MRSSITYDHLGRKTEQTVDNGDGTGTYTIYDTGGVVSTETITGLEVPPLPTDEPGLRHPLPSLEEDYA